MEAKKGEEVGEEGMNERFNQKFVDWMTENAREAILGLSEDDGDPASANNVFVVTRCLLPGDSLGVKNRRFLP